jgi:flagellar hook-length control protein FliK
LAVSVGSGAIDLTSAGGAGQLAEQIIRLAAGNQRDVTLHLHPPDLGDLTVRVQVTGREVAAWFGSPLIQVQQAVSQGMGQLDANLGSAGYTLSGAWVGADASGGSRQDQYVAQRPVPTADGATAIASATTSEIASSVLPTVSGVSVYA